MDDWKDILSGEEQVNEDELKKYLDGNLSDEDKHAFEKKTVSSSFENEALDGLQQFKSKQKLDEYVSQLNKNLHNQLAERKSRKERRRIKDNPWVLVSIIIILGLCVLMYIVIHVYNKRKTEVPATRSEVSMATKGIQ